MNKPDATALAERINTYWARKGWDVGAHAAVHTFETAEGHFHSTYGVRTPGMVNGIPTRRLTEAA